MSELNNKINELRTLKKSYSDLADKVLPTSALLTELENGKQEMVDALATKSVQSSTDKTLSAIASDVRKIPISPIILDGAEVYRKQEIGFSNENSLVWDLYNVVNEIKAKYTDYTGFLLAEYPISIDTITLIGATAYLTSDGVFYNETAEHTFKWEGKTTHWVAYFLGRDGATLGYNFESSHIVLPTKIHIGGDVGLLSFHKSGSLQELVITDGNSVKGIKATVNIGLSGDVVINNIKNHDNGFILNADAGVKSLVLGLETMYTDSTSGTIFIINRDVAFSSLASLIINNVKVLKNSRIRSGSYQFSNLVVLEMPDLEENISNHSSGNYNYLIGAWGGVKNYYNKLKRIGLPSLKKGAIVYQNSGSGCFANLEDIEVGEYMTNLNLSLWEPTGAIANRLSHLQQNIHNHIAAKVKDANGIAPLTITFNKDVRNILLPETEELFASKNWNIAPAKSV